MRRWVVLILIGLLAFGSVTTAQSTTELNELAVHFPADTLMFGAVRTDGAFIDELDSVFQHAITFLPPGTLPPLSLTDFLDLALTDMGTSFSQGVQPWLGETAALGILLNPENLDDDPFMLAAIEADGQAALSFFQPILDPQVQNQAYVVEKIGDFTIYNSQDTFNPIHMAFGNDVMFVTNALALLPVNGISNSLAGNAAFTDVMALLPADQYDMTVGINSGELQALILEGMSAFGTEVPGFLTQLAATATWQAVGLNLTEDRTLYLDVAQYMDPEAVEGFSIQTFETGEVDLSFANHVPADAAIVMHTADFGPLMQAAYAQVRAMGDYLDANGGLAALVESFGQPLRPEEAAIINAFDPAMLLGVVNVAVAGTTGLSLERDVFPVLDGDMIAYLRIIGVTDFPMSPVLPDLAMVFQTSDSQGALHIADSVARAAELYGLDLPNESYGNGRAVVAPIMEQALDMPYRGLDVMLGASDDVLVFGTRPGVEAALQNTGGLGDDPVFQAASAHFVPDAQQVLYISTGPLLDVVPDMMAAFGFMLPPNTVDDGYRAVSLLESASLSLTATNDGVSRIRLAISLADAPRSLPSNQQ